MDWSSIIGGVIQGAGSILSPILGYASARKNNESNERMNTETNSANRDIAEQVNKTNYDVAMQNLDFQKQTQEYNKALQQQIFEREDTAYQRTAQDMLAAGLNPLSMQGTNGAGEVISMTPLNNSFNAQTGAPMVAHKNQNPFESAASAVGAYSSVIQALDNVLTGKLNRDSLSLENDKKRLENAVYAHEHGIDLFGKGKNRSVGQSVVGENDFDWSATKGIANAKKVEDYNQSYLNRENLQRELEHKINAGIYDSDTDTERIITALSDWINNGRGEAEWRKLCETFPILKSFNIFGGQ